LRGVNTRYSIQEFALCEHPIWNKRYLPNMNYSVFKSQNYIKNLRGVNRRYVLPLGNTW
jgi:hypothetical protein